MPQNIGKIFGYCDDFAVMSTLFKSPDVKKAVEKNTDNNKEKSIIKKSNVTRTKPVHTRAKKITKKTDYSNKKKIVDTKEINIEELVKNSGSKGTRSKKVSKAKAIART